ncbi:MAG: chromate transporter [Firmicutes bacterium]|nr:chromate transporter [Bacillota bacterium]
MLINIFLSFFKIGAFSFGGGYAMLPILQDEIIQNHQWLSGKEFVNVLAIAQMTPGPIAINSATFLGYKLDGFVGAFTATTAVILPSLIIVLTIAHFLNKFKNSKYVEWAFKGIRPVVLGLIASAAFFVGKDTFIDIKSVIIALGVFYVVGVKKLHPILAIVGAGLVGVLVY